MVDPTEFGRAMAAIVKDATAPLLKRIEELEARQPERGEKGETGERGEIGERGEAGPRGEKGDPGERGIDGERGPEGPAGERGPQGEKGEQGPAGETGAPGKDADPIDVKEVVAELLAGDEIKMLVDLHVAEALPGAAAFAVGKYLVENPIQNGRDGRDGKDGERGPVGERGEKGADGQNGRDGVDVKDLFRAEGGRLVAVLSDGTTKDLGEFVGKDGRDGANGKDGADGLAFDKVSGEMDPERGYVLRFEQGGRTKELVLPYMRHIGFWREGMDAKGGNTTTHNGNLWIALRDTKATPCIENKDDWALAARKGRDGDKGDPGKDYKPPEPVKLGKRDA